MLSALTMAVGRWFVKVSFYLSFVILLSIILAPSYTEHGRITASSFLLASNGDKHCFPGRNSGLSRQYRTSQRVSPSWKARVGVNLVKLSMFAGYLVLLAGDVRSNPGPSIQLESEASKCAFCSKILRKKQPRLACMSCKRFFHLSCLGDGFKVTRFCHQCLENDSGAEETSESDEPFIPLKLREVVKLRGLKIVHQNIQSLSDKIDQLRLLLHGLHSGIQLITLSESWLKLDRNDSGYEISGYTLFRKDRKGKNGGSAVYARNDVVVTRRDDLEVDSVEGLWLEIAMPKSRGFLVGSF